MIDLVAHGGDVGAAGRAGAHDGGDLGNAGGAHRGLVVEDAAEVVDIGEDFVLQGQESAARVHQVEAGEAILQGHLLGAQVFFDGHREVGAPLNRGVVGDDQAFAARDAADAGDDARAAWRLVAVEAPGRQRREFQEGRARIEQPVDAGAHEQLALLGVTPLRLFAAALAHLGQGRARGPPPVRGGGLHSRGTRGSVGRSGIPGFP